LIELENYRPEIALFHFNRTDDYVAYYFIALCYIDLENFENSIKNNLLFLNQFEATIQDSKSEKGNLKESIDYLLVKYNVHNDLAYTYNRIGDYFKAYEHYEEVLKIFTLEELYSFGHLVAEQDLFLIDINNMLLAVEKIGKNKNGLELLDFAISKYPSNSYFIELKNKFTEKTSNIAFADEIITQVLKPKRPFNIEKFEAARLIAKEKILEDMIIEQIKYGYKVFGKELEVYQDERIFGRQYYISTVNGILDLLLIEKGTNILYVVELKRNEAGVEVVEQIERYIEGLRKILTKKEIRGIICLHKPDNKLMELAKTKKDIEVFIYEFNFNSLN
jgi:tetratricopeptide (TPR) repeat protein